MGTTGVSAKTREAVLKKARELDYQPNRLAVALKSGRRGAIAVFIHGIGLPGSDLSSNFLLGLSGAFENSDLRLWLRFFQKDEEFRAACTPKLTRDVDGLIIAGIAHRGLIADLKALEKKGLPVVSVFCTLPNNRSPLNIATDYRAQCYLATKHLIELGCERIAHFHVLGMRYAGYAEALHEAGRSVQRRLVIRSAGFDLEDGSLAVRKLLENGEKFDGIVAQSDAQAIGAIRELQRHGLRVPEDVKVTGVDDSPLARICEVPVTSATAEMDVCGRVAVETLKEKIEGKKVEPIVIRPRLVVRASTVV